MKVHHLLLFPLSIIASSLAFSNEAPKSSEEYAEIANSGWQDFPAKPPSQGDEQKATDLVRLMETDSHIYLFKIWDRVDHLHAMASATKKTLLVYLDTIIYPTGYSPEKYPTPGNLGYISSKANNLIDEYPIWFKGLPYLLENWLTNLEFAAYYSAYAFSQDHARVIQKYDNILGLIEKFKQSLSGAESLDWVLAAETRVRIKASKFRANRDIVTGLPLNEASILKPEHYSNELSSLYQGYAEQLPENLKISDNRFVHQVVQYMELSSERNIKKTLLDLNGYWTKWNVYKDNMKSLGKEVDDAFKEIASAAKTFQSSYEAFQRKAKSINGRASNYVRLVAQGLDVIATFAEGFQDIGKGAKEMEEGKVMNAYGEYMEGGTKLAEGCLKIWEFVEKALDFKNSLDIEDMNLGRGDPGKVFMQTRDAVADTLKSKDLTVGKLIAIGHYFMLSYEFINGGINYGYRPILSTSVGNVSRDPSMELGMVKSFRDQVRSTMNPMVENLNSLKMQDTRLNKPANDEWKKASDAMDVIFKRLELIASNRKRFFDDAKSMMDLQQRIADSMLEQQNFQNQKKVAQSAHSTMASMHTYDIFKQAFK